MADEVLQLEVTLENGKFKVISKQVKADIKDIGDTTENAGKKAQSGLKGFLTGFTNIEKAIKGFIALQIVRYIYNFGKSMLKMAANMEQTEVAFSTMLGSGEKAKKLLKDLRDYSAKTPLQFEGLADSTKTLLAFGIEGDKVLETLKMLGDVSGGNQQKLDSLALAFGQMSSAGRLMGQDLLQMINAGFNPLEEISRNTGESMASLKKKMEAGQISVKMVTDAFKSATSEGGRFYGLLEKQSRTLGGVFSTLVDNMKLMTMELGQKMAPAFMRLIQAFSLGTEGSSLLGKALSITVTIMAKLVDAIGLAVSGITWLTNSVQKAYYQFKIWNELQNQGVNSTNEYFKAVGSGTDKYKDMKEWVDKLNLANTEQVKIQNHLANTAKALIGDQEKLNKVAEQSFELKKKAQVLDAGAGRGKVKLTEEQRYEQEFNRKKELAQTLLDIDLANENYKQSYIRSKEIEAANFHYKIMQSKLGLDTRYAIGLNQVMSTAGVYMSQENKKLFFLGKVLAIGQTIMNTATGIMKTYAMWGWPLGAVGAAIIGGAGALSLKQIAAQQPPEPPKESKTTIKTPKLATGTYNIPTTMPAILHPGEMVVPEPMSSAIKSGEAALTSGGAAGGGDTYITVQGSILDAKGILNIVDEQRNNRAALMGKLNYAGGGAYK